MHHYYRHYHAPLLPPLSCTIITTIITAIIMHHYHAPLLPPLLPPLSCNIITTIITAITITTIILSPQPSHHHYHHMTIIIIIIIIITNIGMYYYHRHHYAFLTKMLSVHLPKYMKFMEANPGLLSISLQAGVGWTYSAMNLDTPRIIPTTSPEKYTIHIWRYILLHNTALIGSRTCFASWWSANLRY